MKLPRVERWVLPNGLTVLHRRQTDLPLATAILFLRTGSFQESKNQAGVASMTTELLVQGTRRHSAHRLADEIESMGASLGSQATEDYSEVGMTAPVNRLTRALELFADSVIRPIFPPEEIKKERAHTLASLHSRYDTLFNVAYDRVNQALFGAHPYGRLVEGDESSIRRLTRRDLQQWHASRVSPRGSVLSLVTPLAAPEIRRLIDRNFSLWRAQKEATGLVEKRMPVLKSDQHQSMRSNFEQAYFMVGYQAPSVFDPAFRPLKLLNTILGGGMSSRLFMRLREELALAYEVSCFFPTRLQNSQWIFYLGLPAHQVQSAARELERLLENLRRWGVSEKELRQAKQMVKGAYWLEHQSRRRQAWYAGWWEFLGRGADFDGAYIQEIDSISRSQIQAVARHVLAQPSVTVEVVPRARSKR